jgi:hypothetical protein
MSYLSGYSSSPNGSDPCISRSHTAATGARTGNQERQCITHDEQEVSFEFAARTVDVPRMVSIHPADYLAFAGPQCI